MKKQGEQKSIQEYFDRLNLRVMESEDLPYFNKVRNSCCEYLHDKTQYTLDECKSWFEVTDSIYYILELDSQKIGYFRTSYEGDNFFIGLDIEEKFQGRKIAVPAYDKFFSVVEKDEYFLYVDKKNIRAYTLYVKLGFIQIEDVTLNGFESVKMKLVK